MKTKTSLETALYILRREGEDYRKPPSVDTGQLLLSKIKRFVEVFQPRGLIGNLSADELHLDYLVKCIERAEGNALDPITVWWSGQNFYCIDGHHRLQAYVRYYSGNKRGVCIPVSVFEGSLEEAMAFAGKANCKNKLPMRAADRSNFAWRLTCVTSLSAKAVSDASGASQRLVKYMRSALKVLLKDDRRTPAKLGEMPWAEARAEADGNPLPEMSDSDLKAEEEAQRMARRLQREFGHKLYAMSDILARALVIYNDGLPQRLFASAAWEDFREKALEGEDDEMEF